ncbi:MAG: AAA family ATPase [Syntrophorhabdus sp.]
MQDMQAMNEEYLRYWGLQHHPFLLAPDGNMMCITGQYFECFERLKYAITTNKGGVLIASEDAGLGKTTILLKLIEEMKEQYGEHFGYAYVDHPSLTPDQMTGQITGLITGEEPSSDKLKNLTNLKNALIETWIDGGKNIIIIDEGQMLCDTRNVLQELRVLINLTHNNEYLHTFILSGQKALWDTLQEMPEFWQRLPVRYYFTPLRFDETRELIRYRLNKAGLDVAREIFADDAVEMIHKYSKGLPRTIIAVSDLALLNGYSDKTRKISFKEVSKALAAMSGRGESLPYIVSDNKQDSNGVSVRGVETSSPVTNNHANVLDYVSLNAKRNLLDAGQYLKPVVVTLLVLLFIFIGAIGYRFVSASREPQNTIVIKEVEKTPAVSPTPAKTSSENHEQGQNMETQASNPTSAQGAPESSTSEKDIIAEFREEQKKKGLSRSRRIAVVSVEAANIRTAPDVNSPKILTIVQGESLPILGEKNDSAGMKWYKVNLYGSRTGWIAEIVANVQ